MTDSATRPGPGTDDGTVDDDLPCVHCGYNLRGLPVCHSCPECSAPVAESRRGDRLAAANVTWLKRICRGQRFIALALQTGLGALFILLIGNLIGESLPSWLTSLAADVLVPTVVTAVILLLLIGVLELTSPEPRLGLTERPASLRRMLRAGVLMLILLTPPVRHAVTSGMLALGVSPDAVSVLRPTLVRLLALNLALMPIGIAYYLAGLARRVPSVGLARKTATRARYCLLCLALLIVGAVIRGLLPAAAPTASLLGGLRDALIALPGAYLLYNAFRLMLLADAYRILFQRCADNALDHRVGPDTRFGG